MQNPFKKKFITGNYRTIIVSLVLLNTALIFFLIVYIWSYGGSGNTRDNPLLGMAQREQSQPATVVENNVIVWSKPGGVDSMAASRGILGRGQRVSIVERRTLGDSDLWLRINWDSREGWVPAGKVRYIRDIR